MKTSLKPQIVWLLIIYTWYLLKMIKLKYMLSKKIKWVMSTFLI